MSETKEPSGIDLTAREQAGGRVARGDRGSVDAGGDHNAKFLIERYRELLPLDPSLPPLPVLSAGDIQKALAALPRPFSFRLPQPH